MCGDVLEPRMGQSRERYVLSGEMDTNKIQGQGNTQTGLPLTLLVPLVFIAEILENIPGVLCIQASKSASLGGQQVLDCSLHFPDNQPVTYIIQWKKDGLEDPVFIQYDGYKPNVHELFLDRVRLVRGISLEISHIRELDEGWYECKVMYLDGIENENTDSNGTWIYLNVHIPPKIVSSSPTSFHQPLGSMVKIFCKAEGSPKPNVTWTKDGRSIFTSQRITYQSEGSEIIINNLQDDDGGIFKCTYRNTVGLITQTIHLIVEGQAYIIGRPSNKTAVLSQRVTFTCQASGYPSNITYRWYKDNHNVNTQIGYGSRIIINNDGSLVITRAEKDDMGWYVCRPSNGVGQDPEAAAFLNVTYPPKVKDKIPLRLIWALGFTERLDCPVDANPPVTEFVWTKNGLVIMFQNSPLQQLANGSLLVEQVTQSDAGNYRCTAKSSVGYDDSEIMQVEVKDPPRFTMKPLAQYIRQPAQSVTMPCAATGTPFPTISWRRATGDLEYDGRVQVINGNLTIQGLQKSDHGIYECEASNEVRKIVTTTELIIQNTTPHAPYNVSVQTHLFSGVVKWIPAYSSTPQHYLVWFRTIINGIGSNWQTLMVKPQNTTRFTVYNLEPDTTYEFKVLSRNQLGDGQFSETVTTKTLGYVEGIATALPTDSSGNTYIPTIIKNVGPRPSSPINVSATSSDGGILIKWNPPMSSSVKILLYHIDYRTDESDWAQAGTTKAMEDTSFLFKPTQQGVTYTFRVVSHGLLSKSIQSEHVSVAIPAEEDFGLSPTMIGGIIGGLLFLLVAITLAVIAVVCSKRRDRKRATKYNNVKYLGPADDADAARREYAPEWSDVPKDGGRFNVGASDIFMMPESGNFFPIYPPGYHDDRQVNDPYQQDNQYLHDDDRRPHVRGRTSNIEPSNPDFADNNKTLSLPRSTRSQRSQGHGEDDPIDDSSYLLRDNRGYLPPEDLHADVQSPVSVRYDPDRSHGGYPYLSPNQDSVRYRARSPPVRSPTSQVRPVSLPPRPPPPRHWQEADDDDEEVFMPPPISSILPDRQGLPRHSSMKPGVQTYLTDDWGEEPFIANDLSSVLPSPSFESQRPPYQPYQREYENFPFRHVPSGGTSAPPLYNTSETSFNDTMNETIVPREASTIRQDSNSSDSSGRPLNYTRDRLQGAVDRVRKGPRTAKRGPGYRGSGELDYISESPRQPGFPARTDNKPSLTVLDRPSRDPSMDLGRGVAGSYGSVSSSGLGSVGRSRNPALDSRSYALENSTPDSVSSGIGSRNTSSQLTGSSLHSRPSRLGSHPTPQELSVDSGQGDLPPLRKDVSGDENYEFDSVTAAESDLLEALRNYSQVNNANEDLLSALQDGLSTSGFLQDLYPKPRKPSRYSDSDQRFEKLRGEFQQYRQKQQERRSSGSLRDRAYGSGVGDRSYGSGTVDRSYGSGVGDRSYGSGTVDRSYGSGVLDRSQMSGSVGNHPRRSDSSSHSSRASVPWHQDSGFEDRSGRAGAFVGYKPRRRDSSHSSRGSASRAYNERGSFYGDSDQFRQGPMDSDML